MLIGELRALLPELGIIVVDDNSPDGTANALLALKDPLLRVHVRRNAKGYGTAVRDGLLLAIRGGAERIATMDADFSHNPKSLGELFGALDDADMAVGSRYCGGVRVLNWQAQRLVLSLFANGYVRKILGLSPADCTSGFRAYRASLLREMKLKSIKSNGYSFLVELLWRATRARGRIAEVPIIFEERREGESKMSKAVIWESILMPWRLRFGGKA
jgi:dolichol-phosphate mannosyltransferase